MPNLSQIKKNTFWLVIFQLAKMIFPFLILPVLTRRLSVEVYGDLTYVKTIMNFLQIFVDFGFMLSATKELAKINQQKLNTQKTIQEATTQGSTTQEATTQGSTTQESTTQEPPNEKFEQVITNTLFARILLGLTGLFIALILCIFIPILHRNLLFTLLSYLAVFLSIFLFDFLFRGLEIIHIMTIRFILMKTVSTLLTIFFVEQDNQLLYIPLFDIFSSILAILLVLFELKKLGLKFQRPNLKASLVSLKTSFIYFLSDISATAFNAISTIIIGLVFSSSEVAFFGLSIQIIGAIQSLLGQLSSGIYPEMVRQKSYKFVSQIFRKTFIYVLIFTLAVILLSPLGLQILAGNKYLTAIPVIQILAITIFFSYCNTLLGWPTLGVINHQAEVTTSTVASTIFNLTALLALLFLDQLSLVSVAIIRVITEFVLFLIRLHYFRKFRQEFNK